MGVLLVNGEPPLGFDHPVQFVLLRSARVVRQLVLGCRRFQKCDALRATGKRPAEQFGVSIYRKAAGGKLVSGEAVLARAEPLRGQKLVQPPPLMLRRAAGADGEDAPHSGRAALTPKELVAASPAGSGDGDDLIAGRESQVLRCRRARRTSQRERAPTDQPGDEQGQHASPKVHGTCRRGLDLPTAKSGQAVRRPLSQTIFND